MASVISEIIRNNDEVKIIECLLENMNEWCSIADISEMSDVDEKTVANYITFLILKKMIITNNSTTCRLDKSSPAVKGFVFLEHIIVTSELDKAIKATKQELKDANKDVQ